MYAEVNLQRDSGGGPARRGLVDNVRHHAGVCRADQPGHVGRLFFYQTQRRGDRDGSIAKYLYDLELATKRVIPTDLKSVVSERRPRDRQASYASVLPGRAEQENRLGALPLAVVISGGVQDLTAPSTRTEYVMAHPNLSWYQEVDLDPNGGNGRTLATVEFFKPGQQTQHCGTSSRWVPAPSSSATAIQSCPICRTADDSFASRCSPMSTAPAISCWPTPQRRSS